VEVRLRGRDADLVVTTPTAPEPASAEPVPPLAEGGEPARITLRLPEPLKEQVERSASRDGTSVNAWLVRAIATALAGGPASTGTTRTHGRRVTGWAQA
jgi:hypothetical protein